ncbi:MAG: hypothetical protein IJI87_09220 [Mogibacterium sp.]|nr:hypothetical protein [Mogibacterium sp.]MBQ6623456.1 hypothetical protein [Mogibacterium sp.]
MTKAIINGKMYNTETATEIANYWNGLGNGDFNNMDESLYKKKTGEFFLCGEGGPLTKYREEAFGGGFCGGSRIIPLTVDEAKKWCEQYCDADTYIQTFGEPEE